MCQIDISDYHECQACRRLVPLAQLQLAAIKWRCPHCEEVGVRTGWICPTCLSVYATDETLVPDEHGHDAP